MPQFTTRILIEYKPQISREENGVEYNCQDGSQSDSDMDGQLRENEEKEKTDQSQQTTPTTPPNSDSPNDQNYILETITMSTVTQQQILRDAENDRYSHQSSQNYQPGGSPISGILKGGKLWKQQSQQSMDISSRGNDMAPVTVPETITSDDETANRRSVRFFETEEKEKRDSCDGAPASSTEEEAHKDDVPDTQVNAKQETYIGNTTSPDATEMMLTFKLGNHVLISNNSLKPNSAVRQLFPCTKTLGMTEAGEEENSQQYLVTAESLRAFEEAKRSKLPQIIQSGETDETIKRAIERNTLRRSLIRYEPRSKKQPYKTDNSLVERIKQLTCNVDDNTPKDDSNQEQPSDVSYEPSQDVLDSRSSPPGEESRNSPDVNTLSANKTHDKSFSPSSSSTASSNSSSMSMNSNYHQMRKSNTGEPTLIINLNRVDNVPDIQNNFRRDAKPLPDIGLGGPHNHDLPDIPRAVANPPDLSHSAITNKMSSSSTTSESRRQFLSTLAPLTACVTLGMNQNEDYYYHLTNHPHVQPGERLSVASSGTEYSLEDIDEGLKNEDEEHKRIAPDVLAGTPSASESGDELAMFVQQDAGRIERIKKKYHPNDQHSSKESKNDEDDENDDYGFNRRPSVRGIKPRFGTTTEILQQIQNQLQPPAPPPARVAWPYYSESGLTDNSKQKNANQNLPNYQYVNTSEDGKPRVYPPQYRPTSLQDENPYQNCANQRCSSRQDLYQRVSNDCYQSVPVSRQRNGRPQSPPPMDMSKQYHQTMVYIPYNHIEGYQPVQYYQHAGSPDYVSRVSSQNQINKRYIEPIYQSRIHHHMEEHHYNPNMMPPIPPKAIGMRGMPPYPNGQPPPPHLLSNRSESPLPGQFSTARSTQTPAPTMSVCGYYNSNPRYRPMVGPVWQGEGNYATKVNRHSFPTVGPRYPPSDSLSLTDSDSQHSGSLPNGYRQSADMSAYVSKDSIPNSPTKSRFIERGVPEGAASVSPQDISGVSQSSSSTMTSPTSPQNPPVPTNQKPLFYAMNV
ncbi:uncharacterized protein LOC115891547 isoform X2 [Sitophilus oryzae]|uniref:Uncharacterized protein LOC115891547 isoform X2 n=1 Tax=Sitophilus oryzae TaxID=7048 RepID=A0A6J2YXA0_SITOR|nr:uncharacterized protein LOC115891547 isoform X2 [Sitophilus oryzae]